jgi:hypothetical protein
MQKDLTKKAIFKKLEELSDLYPQQRIGQLIYNYIATKCPNEDTFYIEDITLLNLIMEEIDNAKTNNEIIKEIMEDRKKIAKSLDK